MLRKIAETVGGKGLPPYWLLTKTGKNRHAGRDSASSHKDVKQGTLAVYTNDVNKVRVTFHGTGFRHPCRNDGYASLPT